MAWHWTRSPGRESRLNIEQAAGLISIELKKKGWGKTWLGLSLASWFRRVGVRSSHTGLGSISIWVCQNFELAK